MTHMIAAQVVYIITYILSCTYDYIYAATHQLFYQHLQFFLRTSTPTKRKLTSTDVVEKSSFCVPHVKRVIHTQCLSNEKRNTYGNL